MHPPPVVYAVLGNLQGVGPGLAQASRQLSTRLYKSLEFHDVRDDDGGNPVLSVGAAAEHLAAAAELAERLGEELRAAQEAIAGLSVRG